ncbi:MAG: 4-hydroxythreonine-4-phosphate dehydrogenase PdxA [Alphaproteobacteria bacterium]
MRSGEFAAPLALTMGEPAGIGPDITLSAWRQRGAFDLPPFYCIADPDLLRARAELLGLESAIVETDAAHASEVFPIALPVVPLTGRAWGQPRYPSKKDVALVIESIETAVSDVLGGRAGAVVTNPINKLALKAGGFRYPGHTEFLAALATDMSGTTPTPVMMLVGPELRTVPISIHIPLASVASTITSDLIVETGGIVARELRSRFGIHSPRLAVAGLNPHAGEQGTIGDEDESVVSPAVHALKVLGIDAFGPLPADTLFHATARTAYDAALCMYHDQALIPAKTLAFDDAVNVTLGLPFIRTSPDHGTAFDIAGSGTARPSSLIAALKLARRMAIAEAA